MSDVEFVLQTEGLTKKYGRKFVVNDLNIKIRKGDIYGFIGKNGAGKTTTIKMIAGLCRPKSGKMELFDCKSLTEGRKRIGTVIENPAIYPYLSAKQNIEAQRILKGVTDKKVTEDILEIVGLGGVGKKRAKNFSLGMKQRLAIGLALVGDPEFLILDEPINGLDPSGIKDVRELILKLNRELGITILISSHILGELAKMSTAYGIISKGELVDQFTAEELKTRVRPSLRISVNDPEKAVQVLNENLGISDCEVLGNDIKVYENIDKVLEINSVLEENEIIIQSFGKIEGDYENYFIKLMEGGNSNV